MSEKSAYSKIIILALTLIALCIGVGWHQGYHYASKSLERSYKEKIEKATQEGYLEAQKRAYEAGVLVPDAKTVKPGEIPVFRYVTPQEVVAAMYPAEEPEVETDPLPLPKK